MPRPVNFHELSKLSASQRHQLLQRAETDLSPFIEKVVPIIAAVRRDGDLALARFAREFDKAPVQPNEIAATEEDFANAEKSLDPKVHDALKFATESILKFHKAQMPEDMWLHEMRGGCFAGERTNGSGTGKQPGDRPQGTGTRPAGRRNRLLLPTGIARPE